MLLEVSSSSAIWTLFRAGGGSTGGWLCRPFAESGWLRMEMNPMTSGSVVFITPGF